MWSARAFQWYNKAGVDLIFEDYFIYYNDYAFRYAIHIVTISHITALTIVMCNIATNNSTLYKQNNNITSIRKEVC